MRYVDLAMEVPASEFLIFGAIGADLELKRVKSQRAREEEDEATRVRSRGSKEWGK
jgi:hypothetical protein